MLAESTEGSRATLAAGHRIRLRAHGWLADVWRAQGRTADARALMEREALVASAREALGPTVDTTLTLEAIDARLVCAEGGGLAPLRAVLERMRAALGPLSPETRRCERALAEEEASA